METPVVETSELEEPRSPSPEGDIPKSSAELKQLVAKCVMDGIGQSSGSNPDPELPQKPCTYKEFMGCKPRNLYGNEGVVGLTRWIEKVKAMFKVCYCIENSKVRFVACTFVDEALKW